MRQQGAKLKGAGAWSAFVEEIMGKREILDANGLPKKLFTIIVFSGFLACGARFCALSIGRDLRSVTRSSTPAHQLGGTSVKY